MEIRLKRFEKDDQAAAKSPILDGLEEHWGWIDETLNPDLDDIALSYETGHFVTAWDENELVGTGGVHPERPGYIE